MTWFHSLFVLFLFFLGSFTVVDCLIFNADDENRAPTPPPPHMNYVHDIGLVALRGHILSGILPLVMIYMVCFRLSAAAELKCHLKCLRGASRTT